jgi:hypothetical protein
MVKIVALKKSNIKVNPGIKDSSHINQRKNTTHQIDIKKSDGYI